MLSEFKSIRSSFLFLFSRIRVASYFMFSASCFSSVNLPLFDDLEQLSVVTNSFFVFRQPRPLPFTWPLAAVSGSSRNAGDWRPFVCYFFIQEHFTMRICKGKGEMSSAFSSQWLLLSLSWKIVRLSSNEEDVLWGDSNSGIPRWNARCQLNYI